MDHRWICTGTCGSTLTDEEFEKSKKICGADGCTHHGKPFVRAEVCPVCGDILMPGEKHQHKT